MLSKVEGAGPSVSVLIKALNEELHIAACIESAIAATRGMDAEIILVDSLSSDRTVDIAKQYPVRIVQFQRGEDRGCGAAVQLGFQHSRGDYLYVLDADMELDPNFLPKALERLQSDAGLAGVGGRLIDRSVRTASDKRRARAAAAQKTDQEVSELGGGGLYRRKAIDQVGYLANRWLAAFEEADLGARLRAAGWRLQRLKAVAVVHEGHWESNWQMLRRLWRNGRAHASGAFLRAAWNRPWWRLACRKQAHLLLVVALWMGGIGASAVVASWGGSLWEVMVMLLAVPATLLIALVLRKRSLSEAALAFIVWHVLAMAGVLGFLQRPQAPMEPIPSNTLAC